MAKTKVLFVCIGNSCRSQMAEALARHSAADVIIPESAGVSPLGRIAEETRRALSEKGIGVDGQSSKGVDAVSEFHPDIVVNMSGIPGKALFPTGEVLDWDVQDPFYADMETCRRICDDIETRVTALANRLRAKVESSS
jgi:arsenate reductase